jgi:hypothetical protein
MNKYKVLSFALLLISFVVSAWIVAACPVQAKDGYVTHGVKKAVRVTEGGTKKGVEVTVNGTKKGIDAGVNGTKKGLRTAGGGVKKGVGATKNFFRKVF